jgi:hypothetical protein
MGYALTKEALRPTPAVNLSEVFYHNGILPPGWCTVDEFGTLRRCEYLFAALRSDTANTTSTTLANVVGTSDATNILQLALKSGNTYRFNYSFVWRTATATTGLKIGLITPTFTVYAAAVSVYGIAADGTAAEFVGMLTSSGDSVVGTATAATTALDTFAEIKGIIIPSADGFLTAQYAAAVGSAGNVIVRQGSHASAFGG